MCPTFLHRHEIKNVIVIYEMMLVMRVETAVEVAVNFLMTIPFSL